MPVSSAAIVASSKRRNVEIQTDPISRISPLSHHALSTSCLLAILHAAMVILSFPPANLWFLTFLVPAPLGWMAINAATTRRAVAVAIAVQFLMWLWLLRWIVPVTMVGFPALALYMSVYAGLFAWIVRRFSRHPRLGRWPMAVVLPTVWIGLEFLRGDLAFDGYPWYLLAHPLIAWPALAQSADLFGSYSLSFLAVIPAGLMIDALRRRPIMLQIAALVLLFGANITYGVWRMNQTGTFTPGPRVLAIQTNLPQDNKIGWSEEQQAHDVPEFIALTRRALAQANPKPDLIIWPETMVPGLGFESQTIGQLQQLGEKTKSYYFWSLAVQALSAELGAPMLVGSNAWIQTQLVPADGDRVRLDRKHEYNSAYLILGQPPFQRYDKSVLTPFGETMPYISNWKWLEQELLSLGAKGMKFNLDSNPDIKLLRLEFNRNSNAGHSDPQPKPVVSLATPICFEDTVAWFCRRMVYDHGSKRGDVILNISNDGWFNSSHADRRLHAQIARFRCIENRVPMVRTVNTGMSVSIDSCGRLVGAVGGEGYGTANQPGWLLADVSLDSRSTLYGRIGELWPRLCLFATIAGLIGAWWPKKRME